MTIRVTKNKQWGFLEVDIRVRLPDGRIHRERQKAPVQSVSGARRWGEQRALHLAVHWPAEKEEVPTLKEFAKDWIENYAKANKLKPSTINTYQHNRLGKHILPLLGSKRLDEIDEAAVQKLKATMAKHDPKTVNDVLGVLRKVLGTAVEWKKLKVMPASIKPLKRDTSAELEFHDFDAFDRLVEGAAKCGANEVAFVLAGGEAGLRRGELIALEWHDIDFKLGRITVARSDWEGEIGTPKGGRTRRVPMTKRLAAAMQALRHLRGRRVFIQTSGEPVVKETLRSWMERAEKRAGLEETGRIHILRHTFCSHLAMQGAPARAIQVLAGHADLTTTMRYMHLSPSAVDQAISLLDKRLVGGEMGESAIHP